MWEVLGPLLTAGFLGTVLTIVARVFLALHRSAIAAEQRRADDAVRAWEAERARADLREQQINTLLGRPREPSP